MKSKKKYALFLIVYVNTYDILKIYLHSHISPIYSEHFFFYI